MIDYTCEVRSIEAIEDPVGTIKKLLIIATDREDCIKTLRRRGFELIRIVSAV